MSEQQSSGDVESESPIWCENQSPTWEWGADGWRNWNFFHFAAGLSRDQIEISEPLFPTQMAATASVPASTNNRAPKKNSARYFFFFRPPDFREKPKPRRNTFLRQRWWKTFGWKVKFLQRRLDLSCWNLSSWTFIVTCRSYCYLVFDRCSSWDRHCTNTGFSTVYTSLTSFKIQTNANMSSKRSSLAISLRTE